MTTEITQVIFKLNKDESEILKKLLEHIRECRDLQKDKAHSGMIGRANIRIFNKDIELENVILPKTIKVGK